MVDGRLDRIGPPADYGGAFPFGLGGTGRRCITIRSVKMRSPMGLQDRSRGLISNARVPQHVVYGAQLGRRVEMWRLWRM